MPYSGGASPYSIHYIQTGGYIGGPGICFLFDPIRREFPESSWYCEPMEMETHFKWTEVYEPITRFVCNNDNSKKFDLSSYEGDMTIPNEY